MRKHNIRSKNHTGKDLKHKTKRKEAGIPKSLMPSTLMPQGMVKTLEWRSEVNILSTGIADFALVEYKINSMYDPEAVTGGTQPTGFNSIMAFYNFFSS